MSENKNWNWNIEKNFIFGTLTNIKFSTNINTVYLFDLDYTLIKTKSGKKFPTNKDDWEILYPNIPNVLANLTDCIIGIISNQKGLKSQSQIDDWIEKINNIKNKIRIDFVFASITDDRFRKPMCGSYEFIQKEFININWNKLIELDKIYYIGDAFGRKDDFSDTDIKYAINCGFKFKTPEIFFKIANSDKSGNITYPTVNYFEKKEQEKLFEELEKIINSHKKILIVTIGLPASGKSFLRKELIKKFPQFAYSNNDDIHDKVQSRMLVKKISTDYDFIIDDNTNLNKLERDVKLKQFESYYKVGIWFDYDLEVCWHLNWMRMYWFGAKLLPKVTYYTLNKKFDSTNINIGFDKFIKIDKVFMEMNLDNKIKYYF